jgi:GT2 family glycosyltransferase
MTTENPAHSMDIASKSRKILIALAHYQNGESVLEFLSHLSSLPLPSGWSLEVVICDNSGDWDHPLESNLKTSLYNPGYGRHYMGGAWFALERWREENGEFPEWVAVSNHDLVLAPDFFTRLLNEPFHEDVGVVGPDVRLPNGFRQNPTFRHRPSALKLSLLKMNCRNPWFHAVMILRRRLKLALARRRASESSAVAGPGSESSEEKDCEPVYAVHGSLMLFRQRFFTRGGSLSSKCVTYHEEYLVAERARRLGLQTVWHPGLHALHHEHSTMSLMPGALRRQWMKLTGDLLEDIYHTGEAGSWLPPPSLG